MTYQGRHNYCIEDQEILKKARELLAGTPARFLASVRNLDRWVGIVTWPKGPGKSKFEKLLYTKDLFISKETLPKINGRNIKYVRVIREIECESTMTQQG